MSAMDDTALIEASLARVAERLGDPTALVYARLFAEFPQLEVLFVGDKLGTVRGNMLQTTLECLLDHAGPRAYAHHFVGSERVNHVGVGVPPEMFDRFYATVIATFRDALGADWTAETDAAWNRAARALMDAARE